MYERILTFVCGLTLGIIGTFASVHRTQPATVTPITSVPVVQPAPTDTSAMAQKFADEKAALIRQANETEGKYFKQVAELQAQLKTANQAGQNNFDAMKEAAQRFQLCEMKFQTGTIISEPRPLASLPLAKGLFSLSLNTNAAMGDVNGTTPILFVPAQVQVTSRIPGVTYLWMDPQNGSLRGGPFPAIMKQ